MAYFLTDEQEEELNLFLDEQNRKICEEQLNDESVDDELKDIIRATIKADSPIPAFNPVYGYYTVSFTPCEEGNRIYVHHHLTGVSKSLFDPAKVFEELQNVGSSTEGESETTEETQDETGEINAEIVGFDPDLDSDLQTEFEKIESIENEEQLNSAASAVFGSPPDEVLEELGLKEE